jgi:hypothetical protein
VISCGTGKRRYCDERAALAAGMPAGRPFACPLCAGWHLTATTPRPRRPM